MEQLTVESESLFDRLGEETSALHEAVEATVGVLGPSVTVEQYRDFLTRQWGFHRPMEQRLSCIVGLPSVLPDLDRRWKVALLEADLDALGVRARDAAVFEDWPTIQSVDQAIGCLYVIEGSTLGGQFIHRHIAATLPSVACDAGRFLTCYGSETGRMWRALRACVLHASGLLDQDEVIDAARDTFSAVQRWFGGASSAR